MKRLTEEENVKMCLVFFFSSNSKFIVTASDVITDHNPTVLIPTEAVAKIIVQFTRQR